jgi:hypothetical protein
MDIDKKLSNSIKLVYFPSIQPKVLSNWNGERYYTYPTHDESREIYKKLYNNYKSELLEARGSVIISAVDFAYKLNPKSIYLAGFDFSFIGSKTHIEDSVRNQNMDAVISNDMVINGYGDSNPTNLSMKGFLRDLESYIKINSNVNYINYSKKGAKIKGTHYL